MKYSCFKAKWKIENKPLIVRWGVYSHQARYIKDCAAFWDAGSITSNDNVDGKILPPN